MEEKKSLSASSIKSLDSCSWLYWQQYVKKVPQRSNAGALRGSIVHLIFELLLNPRHKRHYDVITRNKDVKGSPAIRRLVIKHLNKAAILNTDNYNLCNDMILVGLKTDFFGAGGSLGEPEFRFELENQNPKYKIRGYIDKLIFYKNNKIKIVDYKGSKNKFSGDDIEANIQAMAYSLVGYKMFNASDVDTEFIFLRYPKQPVQPVHFTREQLKGFEEYLAYIYDIINRFSEKDAKSNFAANNPKNSWLCKAGATWECPYLRPFDYYALIDESGNVARTALLKEHLTQKDGQSLERRRYLGCPAFEGVGGKDEL